MIKEFQKGINVRLSEHFSSKEFDCHCVYPDCQITYIDMDHVTRLEDLRAAIGKPLIIVSGFRCTAHNKRIGGKSGSYHLTGKATDVRVNGEDINQCKEIEHFDGVGRYPEKGFTHLDSRGFHARWRGFKYTQT